MFVGDPREWLEPMGLVTHALKQHLVPRRRMRQTVSLVTVNGRAFKRVRARDSMRARAIAEGLERLGPSPHAPSLVFVHGNEVWVDYIVGERLPVDADRGVAAVHRFYRHLYQRNPRQTALNATMFPDRLRRDLWVLQEIGALDGDEARRILSRAEACVPEVVWLGFDYGDARPENFVLTPDGTAVGIDVENLNANALLGTGLASLRSHWPRKAARAPDLESLLESDDLMGVARQYPYAALCHRAARLKRRLLKGKATVQGIDVGAELHATLRPAASATAMNADASVHAVIPATAAERL